MRLSPKVLSIGLLALSLLALAFSAPVLFAQNVPETTAPCYPYFSCYAATAAHINATAVRETATQYVNQTATAVFLNATGTGTPINYPVLGIVPLNSPTPIPSSTPVPTRSTPEIPHSLIYNNLATVETSLQSVPQDLRNPGLPVLPSANGYQVFGYAKWIFSASAAEESFGVLSPIVIALAARFTLIPFLAVIYLVIFVVVFILRAIVWIIYKIRAMLPL